MMLFLLLLMIGAAATQQSSSETSYTLCGRELAKAHSLYCYGVEPFPTDAKTVKTKMPLPEASDVFTIPRLPERFAYRARRATDAHMDILIKSCCQKPCEMADLLSHC